MKPPEWFVRELKEFDADLRIRWSPRVELWQLERKVRRGLHPGTIRCDGWHDDVIRARDGYILVASVPPGQLRRDIFAKLRSADLWSNGGWKRIADKLDEFDATEEERKLEKFAEIVRGESRELYELIKVREGRTVFNAGWVS